MALQISA